MPDDTTVIHGHATLEWGDQISFVVRPYTKAFLKYMAIALPLYFAIWAFTQSDDGWIALRYEPLGSFYSFLADVWPIYLGVGVALIAVMVGRFCYVFARFPHVNRQLSYDVTAEGVTTRDAANFALTVPWSSIIRTRNTKRALHIQMVTRAWRYVLWRAFTPDEREQILRWATRQGGVATSASSPGLTR
jgi:hypothetical protein